MQSVRASMHEVASLQSILVSKEVPLTATLHLADSQLIEALWSPGDVTAHEVAD